MKKRPVLSVSILCLCSFGCRQDGLENVPESAGWERVRTGSFHRANGDSLDLKNKRVFVEREKGLVRFEYEDPQNGYGGRGVSVEVVLFDDRGNQLGEPVEYAVIGAERKDHTSITLSKFRRRDVEECQEAHLITWFYW